MPDHYTSRRVLLVRNKVFDPNERAICLLFVPVVRVRTIWHPVSESRLPRPKPTRRVHWATYLWPGLAHLWIKGSVAGLTLALAFSVLLNVLILGTLVWPAWLETRLKIVCALGAGLLWLAALWETRCELQRIAAKKLREEKKQNEANLSDDSDDQASYQENQTNGDPDNEASHPNDDRLAEAQKHYLRSDWVEAEQILRRAIRADRRDVEVRLWFAMLLRRTGRLRQAHRRLDRLELFDAAEAWRFEISEERRLLSQLAQAEVAPADDNQETEINTIQPSEAPSQLATTSEETKTEIEQQEKQNLAETKILPFSNFDTVRDESNDSSRTTKPTDQRDQAA